MPAQKPNKVALVLLSLPGFALAVKGLCALVSARAWTAPVHSAPVLLQGAPAVWAGIAELALGLGLLAALSPTAGASRKMLWVAAALGVFSALAFGASVAMR